jgi:SHS2 domain-containing protein
MKKYELISHTADVRIKTTADTQEELFEISAIALCHIMLPDFAIIEAKQFIDQYDFEIEAIDQSALLIDFLAEQLSLMQTYNVMLPKVMIARLNDKEIKGKFSGFKIDSFHEDVKAVTYHEAEIVRNERGQLETIIILDI